jgi:hypothetical protein
MKKLEKSLEVSKLKHNNVKVKLSSGGVASVAVFDLEAMIMSPLMDERIMTEENFADGLNIFTGKPEGVINDFGEIHTGDAWEPALQQFCSNVLHDMPLALVVFVDKSHLDLHSSLSTLPIIFTLSFFNEKSRNSIDFWRPIAFLPNLNAKYLTSWNSNDKKKDPALSVQDEHDCLHGAFSSLSNIHH